MVRAAGKAAAKAKAGARVGVRPARRDRGRADRPGDLAAGAFDLEKFKAGDEFAGHLVPSDVWSRGTRVIFTEAVYWEENIQASGIVDHLVVDGAKRILKVDLKGTQAESLVKWKGANPGKLLEADLCLPDCPQGSRDGVIHVNKLKLWTASSEQDWMKILEGMEPTEDELAKLRGRAELTEKELAEMKKVGIDAVSSSSESKKGKKKKRKKSKKRKKEDQTGREDGKKVQATKELVAVFGKTGLDPNAQVRKRMMRRAKKVAKKKSRKDSSSSSGTREHRLRDFGQPGWGEQRHLWRRGQDQDGLESDSRGFDYTNPQPDAALPGSSKRAAVGPQPVPCSSNILPVLEDVSLWKGDRPYEPRDPVDMLCPGLVAAGQGCPSMRCPDTTPEEFGANGGRGRLQDLPAPRTCPPRSSKFIDSCGDYGCIEVASRGAQGEIGIQQGLGPSWKRRLRFLGCERKRKRERPQGQRREGTQRQLGQEGRQRGERFEGERKGLRGDSGEGRQFEDEIVEKEFHSRGCEGRGFGPSQPSPLTSGLLVSDVPEMDISEDTGGPEEACSVKKFGGAEAMRGSQLLDSERVDEFGQPVVARGFRERLSLEGLRFGEVGPMLLKMFHEIVLEAGIKHSKIQTSGGIFPLPEHPQGLVFLGMILADDVQNVLLAICRAMNSYYGVQGSSRLVPSKVRVSALQALVKYAEVVCAWKEKFEGVSWEQLLHSRSVDYRGEEVKVAKGFQWENIQPALPEQVGEILLEDVCDLGVLAYVNNFEEYLLPIEAQVYTKPPRVMVDDDAWPEVCAGLVRHGLCEVMPLREVYHLRGKPILNGLFGVTKEEFSGSWEVFRLIMNLIPVNKLCRNLGGDVCTLPNWSGMTAYLMDEGEVTLSSEDIRCSFTSFRSLKHGVVSWVSTRWFRAIRFLLRFMVRNVCWSLGCCLWASSIVFRLRSISTARLLEMLSITLW